MPRYCAHWFRVSNLTKSDVKKRGAIISFSFLFLLWRSRLWSLIGRGVECMRHFCFLACNSMDLGVLGKKFENMADIAQNFGRKKRIQVNRFASTGSAGCAHGQRLSQLHFSSSNFVISATLLATQLFGRGPETHYVDGLLGFATLFNK